ncbi:MAG: metalloregulator ArsR/SmtB family transcription factor [Candidatus Pacearchaeota archaeon]|nr:metalloregulator ArsR/SmtB family transcription factor [Candidatus Pacearchaeota archaeon]
MLTAPEIKLAQRGLEERDGRLASAFQALADPTRLKIFRLLVERQDICVTDVANVMGITVPAASHQLKYLETAGLAKRERTGKTICYCIKKEDLLVKKVMGIMS